jgi:preprotein translocase subunit SecE
MSAMERLTNFTKEAMVEWKKVTRPSLAELRESTIVVMVTVAIISSFIFVVDRVVALIVGKLL